MNMQELVLPVMLKLVQGPAHENSLYYSMPRDRRCQPSHFCKLILDMEKAGIVEVAIAGSSDGTEEDRSIKDAEWGKGISEDEVNNIYLYVRLKQWN